MLDFLFSLKSIVILIPLALFLGFYAKYGADWKGIIPTPKRSANSKQRVSTLQIGQPLPGADEESKPLLAKDGASGKLMNALSPTNERLQKILTNEKLERKTRLITTSGNPFHFDNIKSYYGAKAALSAILAIVGLVAGILFGAWLVGALIGALIGYVFPDLIMKSEVKSRNAEVLRVLPETLDLLSVTMNAGSTFEGAFAETARRLPPSILEKQIKKTAANIRAGQSVPDALTILQNNFSSRELETFIKAVNRAIIVGGDLPPVLAKNSQMARDSYASMTMQRVNKLNSKITVVMTLMVIPALAASVIYPFMAQMPTGGIMGGM